MLTDVSVEEKASVKTQKPSFDFGQQKIDKLAKLGYEFLGNLPSYTEVPGSQRLASYLFCRNGAYYQYKGNPFLNPAETLAFDQNNEPLANPAFLKITNQDFIYVIVKEVYSSTAPKYVLFLKENARLTAHEYVAGPYAKNPEPGTKHEIVGGEMYFVDGKLLLVNNKSGSFHSETKKALSFIHQVQSSWNLDQLYFPALEDEEVDAELERRKQMREENKNGTPFSSPKDIKHHRTLSEISAEGELNRFFNSANEAVVAPVVDLADVSREQGHCSHQ